MAQLADKVRQVKRLKVEKSGSNKYNKKQKVAYVEIDEIDQISDIDCEYIEESEVNLVKINPRPPYVCKLLKPLNVKNLVECSKNEKFVTKTYTFYITKCVEIFLLVSFRRPNHSS